MSISKSELTSNINLQRILGCYIMHPEYIEQYWLNDEDIPLPTHRRYFKVLHTCATKGYKIIDNGLINSTILETEWPDNIKNEVTNYFSHLFDRVLDGDITDNIEAYYNEEMKWGMLRDLAKANYDIHYYYCDDVVDPDLEQEAREHFDAATVESIAEHYQDNIDTMLTKWDNNTDLRIGATREHLTHTNDNPPIIEDMLTEGSLNSIVGPAKAGKSFFAFQMAFAIQNGIDFMGHKTNKADVLYVDFELTDNEIINRLNKVEEMYGLDSSADFATMPLSDTWGKPGVNLDTIIRKIKWYKNYKQPNLKVVYMDCYYRFALGKENDAEDTMATLSKLKLLAAEDNLAIVYVHHTNKTNATSDDINAGSGSGVHGRVVTQLYRLNKKKDGIDVNNTGRNIANDKFACRRNDFGYFDFDGASVDEQKPSKKGFPIMNKSTKMTRDQLLEEYPEVCCDINEKGISRNALRDRFEKKYGTKETKESLIAKGFIKDQTKDRFYLPD